LPPYLKLHSASVRGYFIAHTLRGVYGFVYGLPELRAVMPEGLPGDVSSRRSPACDDGSSGATTALVPAVSSVRAGAGFLKPISSTCARKKSSRQDPVDSQASQELP